MPLIRVQEPDRPPREIPFTDRALIGRHASNEVSLWDVQVSRHHAIIRHDPAGWVVEDLRSRNGTRIDGQKVREGPLREGSLIEIGRTTLFFHQTDHASDQRGESASGLHTRDLSSTSDCAEDSRDHELHRAWRDLVALQELVTRLHGAREDTVFHEIVQMTAQATGAEQVLVLNPKRPFRVLASLEPERLTTSEVDLPFELLENERRWLGLGVEGPLGGLPMVRSLLCQAIQGTRHRQGLLIALHSRDAAFDAYHQAMLASLGLQAGIALDNYELYQELEASYFGTIEALANALDAKDGYTAGHSRRASLISEQIAHQLGLSHEELRVLRLGALLHDIGKIGVDDHILKSTARYGPQERSHMERHTVFGDQILEPLPGMAEVRSIVRHHHERWDGEGYPDRLRGDHIPLGSRIVCVADSLDAMTSRRSYREARPLGPALEEVRKAAGSQFDPMVVQALFTLEKEHRLDIGNPTG